MTSLSPNTEVAYQMVFQINKILRTPDRRFKTGYRESKIIATSNQIIEPDTTYGVGLAHVHKDKKSFVKTEAFVNVTTRDFQKTEQVV